MVQVELEERYGLLGPKAQRFLQVHPHLTGFLLEAHPYLQTHFGPSPLLRLDVIRDPEIGSMGELIVYILTSLPVDEAQARLDRFDDEWLLDQLDHVDGLLDFGLEFI